MQIQVKPIVTFAKEFAPQIGVKPEAIRRMIDRNFYELRDQGIVFNSKGKSRLVNPERFFEWYLS
ncbi:hypothetical protein [Thiosulfativibrio zosterae]|uniref:DNA-binding protein n=1 Tax=Thiosulfativibrio zosterae TaxID=2675053 RepID=A0A6F8PN37_9GAMM|nr:hypothetical protein [Thiosulfativibrio zosterae]BBP43533.1 hypothetical protein THMIRHAT_12790 [Thiosulfativibrio zosterae]